MQVPRVLKLAAAAVAFTGDCSGWAVVEQDVLPGMGMPRESARRNREYLRSLGV